MGRGHIPAHKSGLNKYKKIEIIPTILSDHDAMKLEANCKKTFGKLTKIWRLKNMKLNNEWVNQEIEEEMKKYKEENENENTMIQNL